MLVPLNCDEYNSNSEFKDESSQAEQLNQPASNSAYKEEGFVNGQQGDVSSNRDNAQIVIQSETDSPPVNLDQQHFQAEAAPVYEQAQVYDNVEPVARQNEEINFQPVWQDTQQAEGYVPHQNVDEVQGQFEAHNQAHGQGSVQAQNEPYQVHEEVSNQVRSDTFQGEEVYQAQNGVPYQRPDEAPVVQDLGAQEHQNLVFHQVQDEAPAQFHAEVPVQVDIPQQIDILHPDQAQHHPEIPNQPDALQQAQHQPEAPHQAPGQPEVLHHQPLKTLTPPAELGFGNTIGSEQDDFLESLGAPNVQYEFRVEVKAGGTECFFQKIKPDAKVHMSFEVNCCYRY